MAEQSIAERLREHATAFTPGPWVAAQPWAGFSEVRGADGTLVFGLAAGTKEEKQPDAVCDANCRLVAAAPCLFAVAESLLDSLVAGMLMEGWPRWEIERRPEIARAMSVLRQIAGEGEA